METILGILALLVAAGFVYYMKNKNKTPRDIKRGDGGSNHER